MLLCHAHLYTTFFSKWADDMLHLPTWCGSPSKTFSQPSEQDFHMGVKYIEMQGCFIELEESSQKWHSLSAKVRYARIYPSIHIIVRGHFFGRRYCVMISCEAWPRQKKEHVECNVETCADMCLWRNLCFCFTIGFFGGLRFGVCFSNAFGMPFLFSERCRFQVRSLMLVMSNRTLHSCQYFGPSIGGEQSIINNHP